MGTIRKMWRKLRRWFNRKARERLDEAKQIIRDVFSDMRVSIHDLFDEDRRDEIADELRARLREVRDDLADWIIEWALETLWDEVREGFGGRRS